MNCTPESSIGFNWKLATFLTFSSQHSHRNVPVNIDIYVTVLLNSPNDEQNIQKY